jgi:hypothetical protein
MEIGKRWLSMASATENIDALIEEVLDFIPPDCMMEAV